MIWPQARGSVMSFSFRIVRVSVLSGVAIVAIMAGCAEVRKLTYSEDFTYVENREVKSLMRKMEKGVNRLEKLLSTTSDNGNALQQSILSELGDLEKTTARLSAGHTQTNQLFISDHIEQFITDLGTARMFAKATPPDYSRVEDIVSNCQECHRSR